ncbi:hypothetical protein [Mesorhizobium sp. BR-1-1-10]|uniref:hypothetical protein n=1 Tax=Mesorhizobium sp. BR-1-1-10 TaxID=2876660 RepID=UPI001CD15E35|nr:hypothetical protein [Mesorhizobium sp. BR-1-1-10]MBZ9975517.1 hypothetical protein [Mesorhizobium sp. BR-1-1-10]
MTTIEFYLHGKAAPAEYDCTIDANKGITVQRNMNIFQETIRVLVKVSNRAFMDTTLIEMGRFIIMYPECTVALHGFHD